MQNDNQSQLLGWIRIGGFREAIRSTSGSFSRNGAREPAVGRSRDPESDSEEVDLQQLPQQQQQQQQPQFRRSLVSPTKTKKSVLKRSSSSTSSSSSSGGEPGAGTGQPQRSGKKLEPLSRGSGVDSLESEIQISRSDNSILRQDIQV